MQVSGFWINSASYDITYYCLVLATHYNTMDHVSGRLRITIHITELDYNISLTFYKIL
jgi:hypothetical protein